MKIGILTNYHLNHVGGAEQVIDRLAQLWHAAGHEVVLFSSRGRRKEVSREWSCAYRHIEIPAPFSTRFFLSRYLPYLEREHRRGPLDLVFASDTYWPGHVARLFQQQHGVPYVICSHGSDCRNNSRFLPRPICRRRMSLAIRDAAGVACISRYVARRLQELATPRGIVRLMHNGWPDEWATEAAPPPSVSGPYLFAMGRAVELKGFQTLIEAYARLRQNHSALGLVIAGGGPYLNTLFQQAAGLGLLPQREISTTQPGPGGRVYLPGFVHGELKRSLAHHATLGVCPSILDEPQCVVLLEMLCGGVPVIASNVGGIPDMVQPGINGELFEAQNADELSHRIHQLLSDPQRLSALAGRAAASVDYLRWSKVAERYMELFEEIVQPKRGYLPAPHVRFPASGEPTDESIPASAEIGL